MELATFSKQYLAPNLKDDYQSFMKAKDFPATAVPKDLSDVQGHLKKRKVTFSRSIELTAPPDAFKDLIKIQSVKGDGTDGATGAAWTQILIRDRVRSQQ